MAVSPLTRNEREGSRVRIIILLFTILMAVLVVEELATPFVVTVHSQGCWTVETIGLFQTTTVHGCGNGSWAIFDLLAVVRSSGPATTAAPTIFLGQGTVAGGCVGGSECSNLGGYSAPSPLACSGCQMSRSWPNPLAIFVNTNSTPCPSSCYSSSLATFPFFTAVLLVYLAISIPQSLRVYSGYLKGSREVLGWGSLSDRRKTVISFALGFFAFRTYQYATTTYYLFAHPILILAFPAEVILSLIVIIWLKGYLGWTIPFKLGSPGYPAQEIGRGIGEVGTGLQAAARGRPSSRLLRYRPVIIGILLISALVVSIVTIPPLYSYMAAALAPKSNLQVTASPSTFRAVPNAASNTSITVKNLRGSTENIAVKVDQTPACNGECTVGLLGVTLSSNSFDLSVGQSTTLLFNVHPEVWASAGSYDFLVTALPGQGLEASTIVTVDLAGFNLTATPQVLSFTQNSYALSTIRATSVYGYSGEIRLFTSTEAQGPMTTVSQGNLTLPPEGVSSTTLNVTSLAQGSYDIGINAYNGRIFQTITVHVTTRPISLAADFALSTNVTGPIVNAGKPVTAAISVSSLNGCICIVRISAMGNSSYGGPSPQIVTATPTYTPEVYITVVLGVDGVPEVIGFTVTGSSGSIVHSLMITLTIQ